MSRKKKRNFGTGDLFNFHGAFEKKSDAVVKEKATPGSFIKGIFTKSGYRYAVLTKRAANSRKKNLEWGTYEKGVFHPWTRRPKSRKKPAFSKQKKKKNALFAPFVRHFATERTAKYVGDALKGLGKRGKKKPAKAAAASSGVISEVASALRNLGYGPRARQMAETGFGKASEKNFDSVFRASMQKNPKRQKNPCSQCKAKSGQYKIFHSGKWQKFCAKCGHAESANPHRRPIKGKQLPLNFTRKRRKATRKKTWADKLALRLNPAEVSPAARMYQRFHGKTSKGFTSYAERLKSHDDLAQLGKLVKLILAGGITIDFLVSSPQVCCDSDGDQLYFVGGDQDLSPNLKSMGVADSSKQYVDLGEVRQIEYVTRKKFDNFEEVTYYHKLGEETGERPRLVFDRPSKLMLLTGGAYKVKAEGIVN